MSNPYWMLDLATQADYADPGVEDDYGPSCPSCGCEMDWEDCHECGGEGGYDAHELDPIVEPPGAWKTCMLCVGRGGAWFCVQSRAFCEAEGQKRAMAEEINENGPRRARPRGG